MISPNWCNRPNFNQHEQTSPNAHFQKPVYDLTPPPNYNSALPTAPKGVHIPNPDFQNTLARLPVNRIHIPNPDFENNLAWLAKQKSPQNDRSRQDSKQPSSPPKNAVTLKSTERKVEKQTPKKSVECAEKKTKQSNHLEEQIPSTAEKQTPKKPVECAEKKTKQSDHLEEQIPNLDPKRLQYFSNLDPFVRKVITAAKVLAIYDPLSSAVLIPPDIEAINSKKSMDSKIRIWRQSLHSHESNQEQAPLNHLEEPSNQESILGEKDMFKFIFEEIERINADKRANCAPIPSEELPTSQASNSVNLTKDDITLVKYLCKSRQISFGLLTDKYQKIFFQSLANTSAERSKNFEPLSHLGIEFSNNPNLLTAFPKSPVAPAIKLEGFPKY